MNSTHTQVTFWTPKIVFDYLEEAAAIHRRTPDIKVRGFHCLWPETMQDQWPRLYDLIHGKNTLGSPYSMEITYSEKVMEWLRWLKRPQQQALWMRCNLMPWKILVAEFGKSKTTLWREVQHSLEVITVHLNQVDPKGEAFIRLRTRANGGTEGV